MDIRIKSINDKGRVDGVKRLRAVKEYKHFTQYDVIDSEGERLYSEDYSKSDIERLMV